MKLVRSLRRNCQLSDRFLLIFDFDGTIVDSNRLKAKTISRVLRQFFPTELVESQIRDAKGLSRYEIVEGICSVHPSGYSPQYILDCISKKMFSSLLQAERFTNFDKFLCFDNKLAIVSLGDGLEIREFLKSTNCRHCFEGGIFGLVRNKSKVLSQIANDNPQFNRKVYFGDRLSDWEDAKSSGFEFVLVQNWSDDLVADVSDVSAIGSLFDFNFSLIN